MKRADRVQINYLAGEMLVIFDRYYPAGSFEAMKGRPATPAQMCRLELEQRRGEIAKILLREEGD